MTVRHSLGVFAVVALGLSACHSDHEDRPVVEAGASAKAAPASADEAAAAQPGTQAAEAIGVAGSDAETPSAVPQSQPR